MLQKLVSFTVTGGYRPSTSLGGPDVRPDTLYKGSGFFVRPGGRLTPIKGAAQIAAVNIGARIYALDQYRGEIAGGLVSSRLPKASLVRYQGSALFFLSENTSQQVYINESTTTPYTLTGVTTSATAGKLRVALLSSTTYTAYDAGIDPPQSIGTVSTEAGGSKSMDGVVSIVACARRLITDSTSNPTPASVQTLTAAGNNRIRVVLPALASGTDAWIYAGTEWGRGNFGPWKTIREVRYTIEGSIGATNGAPGLVGTSTRFLRDLRAGDLVTISGADYTILSVTSDTVATLSSNFAGSTASYTGTMKQIVLDWRNGELLELVEFDNDTPPLLDGLMLFNNVPFGWKGNVLYPSKIGNPESFPRALARSTQSGADIVYALAGDGRIYLMTTNGLEVVTFTQSDTDPFLIRQVWAFGFTSPTQAIVAEGTLYAAVGTSTGVKIVRTRVDDSPDLEFSANVETDMMSWNLLNVVMGLDPTNGAVIAFHNDGSNTTGLIYMLQQGVWSLPYPITGRVKDAATVANVCDVVVYDGTNFRPYQFEGGAGTGISKYVAWPFYDGPEDSLRKILKKLKVTGDVDSLYIYAALPGASVPDPTSTGAATAGPFTLTGTLEHETFLPTNIQNAQSYSIRLDSDDADAEIVQVDVWGLVNQVMR